MIRLSQAEQAARRKAEEQLAQSMESEAALKTQLDSEVKKRSKEQKQLAAQREEVKSERAALDQMRAEFENELQQARGEMQRAQDALQGMRHLKPYQYHAAMFNLSPNLTVNRAKALKAPEMVLKHPSAHSNRIPESLADWSDV